MNTKHQQLIVEAIKARKTVFAGSASKLAVTLGISPSQLSRILKGDTHQVLSDGAWISIARRLGVNLTSRRSWNTAKTPVFTFIENQLDKCRTESISLLLCDAADIGKTYTARHYAMNNENVAYIDCSQYKTKRMLVRAIAREFGINMSGRYADIYDDLTYYLRTIECPLVILDEVGDLAYEAFLELKALWNATEGTCGWYMMGADGLREKIRRGLEHKRVGFTEIFSRYGSRYQRITPEGREENDAFTVQQAAQVITANIPAGTQVDVNRMIHKSGGSLRRISYEMAKLTA